MPDVPKTSLFPDACQITCEITPNPGRMRMYTSGCPKNQNKCWYRIGSPPPLGSKNLVLKLRSSNSIVIAAASTGNDRTSIIAVIKTAQTKRGSFIMLFFGFILTIVVMKLIAPKIDDTPARCREKIPHSITGFSENFTWHL